MQQVNLYTEDFRPKQVVLPLAHIVMILVGVIFILATISFWLNSGLAESEIRVSDKSAQVDQMKQRLVLLEEKAKLLKRDDSLVSANQRLQLMLDARQQMIEMLDSVVVKEDDGFSGLLTSLARQRTQGLWLNRIKIGASGHSMTLEGRTRSADSVPKYLQNLRNEPGFIGRSFTLFSLQLDAENDSGLGFSLHSQITGSNDSIILGAEKTGMSERLDAGVSAREVSQ